MHDGIHVIAGECPKPSTVSASASTNSAATSSLSRSPTKLENDEEQEDGRILYGITRQWATVSLGTQGFQLER